MPRPQRRRRDASAGASIAARARLWLEGEPRVRSRPRAAGPAGTHVAARSEGRPVPGPYREARSDPYDAQTDAHPHTCAGTGSSTAGGLHAHHNGAGALSGQLQGGYPILIDAEVHDANGAPIPSTSITWTISAAGQQLLSFTDPDFTALTEAVNVPAGTALTVQASYAGDTTHAPSSNQATITIPIPVCTDPDGDGDQNAGGVDDGDGCI